MPTPSAFRDVRNGVCGSVDCEATKENDMLLEQKANCSASISSRRRPDRSVRDVYFDDQRWWVRYLVVDAGIGVQDGRS